MEESQESDCDSWGDVDEADFSADGPLPDQKLGWRCPKCDRANSAEMVVACGHCYAPRPKRWPCAECSSWISEHHRALPRVETKRRESEPSISPLIKSFVQMSDDAVETETETETAKLRRLMGPDFAYGKSLEARPADERVASTEQPDGLGLQCPVCDTPCRVKEADGVPCADDVWDLDAATRGEALFASLSEWSRGTGPSLAQLAPKDGFEWTDAHKAALGPALARALAEGRSDLVRLLVRAGVGYEEAWDEARSQDQVFRRAFLFESALPLLLDPLGSHAAAVHFCGNAHLFDRHLVREIVEWL